MSEFKPTGCGCGQDICQYCKYDEAVQEITRLRAELAKATELASDLGNAIGIEIVAGDELQSAIDGLFEMQSQIQEWHKLAEAALPNEQGTNRYGLDVAYFRNAINRELNRPLVDFKPDELARVFARLSRAADSSVMHEPEFAPKGAEANTIDPAEIYLQPECCADSEMGRLWCEHDAPEECDEGARWTRYVRADTHPAPAKVPDGSELVHIGYTNGAQVLYCVTDESGSFYPDTENDTCIPVYMLRTHAHRLESTTNGQVTLDRIKREWAMLKSQGGE